MEGAGPLVDARTEGVGLILMLTLVVAAAVGRGPPVEDWATARATLEARVIANDVLIMKILIG